MLMLLQNQQFNINLEYFKLNHIANALLMSYNQTKLASKFQWIRVYTHRRCVCLQLFREHKSGLDDV